jgi:hypothetical protein
MKKLNQKAINDVLKTDQQVRAEVLFKFLLEGKSHRKIEREHHELKINDGWSSWKITQFYGFENSDKGRFSNLDFQHLLNQIGGINMEDVAVYHLENKVPKEEKVIDDGKDILRWIKTRVGQSKLRKELLKNYQNKCALCEISTKILLITSHIKSWTKSSPEEKVDLENAILLCKLHDGMFENGLIALDDNYEILFKDKVNLKAQKIETNLTFREPIRKSPNKEYLRIRRKKYKFKKDASR